MSIAKWEIAGFGLLAGIAFIVAGSGLQTGSLGADVAAIFGESSTFSRQISSLFFDSLSKLGQATHSLLPQSDEVAFEKRLSVFPEVALEGEAALVMDARTGEIIYANNASERLPLASLTKLATVLVADNILPQDTKIKISSRALAEEGDNLLKRDDVWNKKALSDFSLIVSSNDGARALAEASEKVLAANRAALAAGGANPATNHALIAGAAGSLTSTAAAGTATNAAATLPPTDFVDAMNRYMHSIGISGLSFNNPTGLDVASSTAGGYGSATDIATLMRYILVNKPELVANTTQSVATFKPQSGALYNINNTDTAIPDIPGLIASKTGFTNLAQGNLVVAYDADIGRPMIAVVLGSSTEGRFSDILTLIHASKAYLSDTMSP